MMSNIIRPYHARCTDFLFVCYKKQNKEGKDMDLANL